MGVSLTGLSRRILQFGVAASLLALAACDSVEERVAEHHQRGLELVESGEPAKAMLEFRNALQLDQDYVPSRFQLATLLGAEQSFEGAVGHMLKVVELDPEHLQARIQLTQIMLLAEQLDEALKHSEAAYKVAPNDANVLSLRSAVALNLENFDTALSAAEEAIKIDPSSTAAGMALSAYHLRRNDPNKALEIIDAYVAKNETDLALHIAKLQVIAQLEGGAGVGAQLEKMVELFPEQPSFRQSLIRWHVERNDEAAAEREMRALIAQAPNARDAVLDLVRYITRVRGLDSGRAELEAQIAKAEEKFPLQAALAALDYQNGQQEQAKTLLRELIESADAADADTARVQLARFLATESNFDEATALVDAALGADAKNVEALAVRAAIRIEQNDAENAVLDLRTALDESPSNVNLLTLMALAYERNGSIELATESLAKAAEAADFSSASVLTYAEFLNRTNQVEAMDIVLTEAAGRRPRDREILSALAQVQLQRQKWLEAEETAAKLKELEDADASQRVLAAALSGQERFGESIEVLKEVMSGADAEDGGAMAALVNVYTRAGQVENAEAFLNDVLASDPDNTQAMLLKGALLVRSEKIDEATALFNTVISEKPEDATGYQALARLQLVQGQDEAAEKTLSDGVAAASNPDPLRLLRAVLYERGRRFDDAIGEYRTLFEANPDSVVIANNLASLISDYQSDDPAALAVAFEAAKRLRRSELPAFQDTYGWVMYLQGDYAEALRSLAPAVEALADNPLAHYHTGMAYKQLDRPQEARTHLEKALELGGDGFGPAEIVRAALAELPTAAN